MAAVIACGEGAALSHRSAGRLWGIIPSGDGLPEVTRPKGWKQRPGIVQHRSPLPEDEVDLLAGIPVTGLSRTLLDLASVLSQSQLEGALNEAEVLGLTDRISIRTLLERYPSRRGTAVLRRLLSDEDVLRGITRRELEARFAAVLATTDLPRPQLNVDLAVGGRFFEIDCLWREQRLAVELDGRFAHRTWRRSERDREKDRLLQVDGWRVVRITWRQLRDDAPGVIADLRRLLRQ
jgi:very-short-patch-repair endonuclease